MRLAYGASASTTDEAHDNNALRLALRALPCLFVYTRSVFDFLSWATGELEVKQGEPAPFTLYDPFSEITRVEAYLARRTNKSCDALTPSKRTFLEAVRYPDPAKWMFILRGDNALEDDAFMNVLLDHCENLASSAARTIVLVDTRTPTVPVRSAWIPTLPFYTEPAQVVKAITAVTGNMDQAEICAQLLPETTTTDAVLIVRLADALMRAQKPSILMNKAEAPRSYPQAVQQAAQLLRSWTSNPFSGVIG